MKKVEKNSFRAAAKARWSSGEDGEVIARELAHALLYVISEGVGSSKFIKEVKRLIKE